MVQRIESQNKQTKPVQVTFTTKRIICPQVTINSKQIPVQTEVKCLGLYLDQNRRDRNTSKQSVRS
jgi:hypothetical protein